MKARMALIGIIVLAVSVLQTSAAEKELTLDQVRQQHLKNFLGDVPPEGMMAPRLLSGISAMKILDGGTGLVKGTMKFRTAPDAALLLLQFDSQGYPRDGFRLKEDGTVLPIEVSPGSAGFLAGFIDSYRFVVRSGLFGSVLSTSWPFLKSDPGIQMQFKGEKKVDKQKLLHVECGFEAGMKSDVYFDPKTFRHVRTVHRIPPDRGNAYLTEEFENFQKVGPVELPVLWRLTVEWRGNRRILYEIGVQNIQSPPPEEGEDEQAIGSR